MCSRRRRPGGSLTQSSQRPLPVPSLRGRVPPNGCLCPHLGLLKSLFLEHHATTQQQPMMEKGIIRLKNNSPLTFF